MDGIDSSVTPAPPMVLPHLRAPSCLRALVPSCPRAFEGAVAEVLALHAGHGGEHGEHDAGRVVRTLRPPARNSSPISLAVSSSASASRASSIPQPSRLCSWTARGTAAPGERISPASCTAAGSSGRLPAPVKHAEAKPTYRRRSPRSAGWSAVGPESSRRRVAWREPSRLRDWALGLPGSAW